MPVMIPYSYLYDRDPRSVAREDEVMKILIFSSEQTPRWDK